ncbi:MAG TPA: MBL fold metallo-hydrolase [Candidatus Binatus sp.]|nr:MBL fold metallo-hydrolase [Candidatus Binatus sp.]
MKRRLPLLFAIVGVLNLGAAAPVRMTPVKLTDNVYMLQHPTGSSNATVVFTNDGVLVFDADIRTADQTLEFVRKQTDKKIKYLITSHSAGDHATGAWHFREDKPIWIATKNQVHDLQMQELKEFSERRDSTDPRFASYKGRTLGQPDVGIDGPMTLYFGGTTFVITPEGRGHTTGDLTLYIPQKRLLLMGDLLDTEIHPGQGESGEIFFSNVKGWIHILDNVIARNLPVETYVPGHGPAHLGRGIKDIEEQKRYFVVMRDEIAKMIAAGKTLEQIQKEFKVPQEFAHYTGAERLRAFYKLFYNQLMETGY